jgi:1-deoxy-D-xylulose-5-phosphate reductoisomerase
MKKKIALLGSTGSIGTQTCDVVAHQSDKFEIIALACGHDSELFREQVRTFSPKYTYTADKPDGMKLSDLATLDEVDIVVIATPGHSPLEAAINASLTGKILALANKEALVSAGELINKNCKASGSVIHPIDSEHSAIWQCLAGEEEISRIILTASGGPFRKTPKEDLKKVTPEMALKHPSWKMGPKVTIDSSTLMNKGLEVIEAYRLFGTALDQIEVLVHPQSIIHSMVEFVDGAIKAQMGLPDMRLPIQYALSYPHRLANPILKSMNLKDLTTLEFEQPDTDKFPCLDLARKAARLGSTYPTALCAADEIAVQAFLDKKIEYLDIPVLINQGLEHNKPVQSLSAEIIRNTDIETKEYVAGLIK